MPANTSPSKDVILADYLALTLVGLVFVPVAAFTLLLMLDAGEARWTVPLVLGALWPLMCCGLLKGLPQHRQKAAVILVYALAVMALGLTGFGTDVSYDGLAYHSDAIHSLLRGDNPYYGGLTGNEQGFDYWTLHYPKATWYFSALIIHATGQYQAGKLYHLLPIASVFFFVFAFCRRREVGNVGALLMAAAAALGPIQMSQLWTYYVDGALGSMLTLLIFSGLNLLAKPRKVDALVFCLSGLLLVNIKFTGVVYALVVCGAGGVLLLAWRARLKIWIVCGAVILVIGMGVMGFDPYVTNAISEGNPFYPLLGPHKFDAITRLMPPVFRGESSLTKLVQALFCRGVFISLIDLVPLWKVPFAFGWDDVSQFKEPDVKISGWGVLFGGLLLASVLLYGLCRGWRHKEATFAAAVMLASVLVNPHAWWARFVPQLALVPLFLILPCLQSEKYARWAKAFLVLCLVNSLLILWPNTVYYHQQAEKIDAQVEHILASCGTGTYAVFGNTPFHYEQFLEARGIIREGHIDGKQRPKGAMPFRELFLVKKGCG